MMGFATNLIEEIGEIEALKQQMERIERDLNIAKGDIQDIFNRLNDLEAAAGFEGTQNIGRCLDNLQAQILQIKDSQNNDFKFAKQILNLASKALRK